MKTMDKFADLHEFDRLSYFYGQILGVRDFKDEQRYFREKLKLHHRFLHGHGVVCGLEVSQATPVPFDDFVPVDRPHKPTCSPRIKISAGLAIDEEGNELLIRHEVCVELWKQLSKKDKHIILSSPVSKPLYVSLEYRELELEPTQSVLPTRQYDSHECEFARRRDSFCVRVTLEKPMVSDGCGCCDGPTSKTVLLAVVNGFSIDQTTELDIDNSVRRPIGLRRTTRISGINWAHNGSYSTEEVIEIWKTGLEVHFTAPVLEKSIVPGIMDIMIFQGGGRISGAVQYLNGDVSAISPSQGWTHGLRYRLDNKYREFLSGGDRVHIILRSCFLLDKCCQPVDGLHVGGWVPILSNGHRPKNTDGSAAHPWQQCQSLRQTYGLLTSGNGTPGHNFESWFHVDNGGAR